MRILMLGIVFWAATMPAYSEVAVKFDRFKNQTDLVIGPGDGKPSSPSLFVVASFPGEHPAKAPAVAFFSFHSTSKDWEYLRCHETDLLLDGQSLHIETKHDGTVGSGYVSEYVEGRVTFEKLKRIASAKKVEVKICNTEFSLSDDDMTDLRQLVTLATPSRVTNKKAPTAKKSDKEAK